MKKSILVRHINGELDDDASQQVLDWIAQSPHNRNYYKSLVHELALVNDCRNGKLLSEEDREIMLDAILKHKYGNPFWKSRFFWGFAAACVLLALSVLGNLFLYGDVQENLLKYERSLNVAQADKCYYTEYGVKGSVTLPDGTVVDMNSGSSVSYPEHFGMDCRKVHIDGEAYFNVVRNEDWPMVVTTSKGLTVEVLGTKFHIKSYRDDDYEQTTLFSGKVNVSKKDTSSGKVLFARELKPMECVNIADCGSEVTNIKFSPQVDTLSKVAWKRGTLLFENTSLEEAFRMLERWHGCSIEVKDTSLYALRLNAQFSSESMVHIMNLLKFSLPVDFRMKGQNTFAVYRCDR